MAGVDLAVEGAVIVGLRIELDVCVALDHFQSDVRDAVMRVFYYRRSVQRAARPAQPRQFQLRTDRIRESVDRGRAGGRRRLRGHVHGLPAHGRSVIRAASGAILVMQRLEIGGWTTIRTVSITAFSFCTWMVANDRFLRNGRSGMCGCCEGIGPETPQPVTNRPALSAVAYRVGSYAAVQGESAVGVV